MESDYTTPLIVSGILCILLAVFYLYKHNNSLILGILASFYSHEPAKIERGSKTQDWLIFILLLVVVVIMGIKLVTFMVVISDSMKPTFERGDIILTQSIFLTPEPGDIITFNVQDMRTAESHRVLSVDNNTGAIRTQGDAYSRPDSFRTTQKDVIAKAVTFNGKPVVIKNLGALFIVDYSKQGIIFKYGDKFSFVQKLSASIKAWGLVITMTALLIYILSMRR